jgi:hypothetical protein
MSNDRPPATGGSDPRWRLSPTKIVVALILLVGIVVPLLVGTYARVEPRLFGFPFFYWYQLLWVFLAAGLCYLSYVLLKRENRRLSPGVRGGSSPHGDDGFARDRDDARSDRTEGETR